MKKAIFSSVMIGVLLSSCGISSQKDTSIKQEKLLNNQEKGVKNEEGNDTELQSGIVQTSQNKKKYDARTQAS